MEFRDTLRQLRVENSLTLQELADKVGLKKAAIYKYEHGLTTNPKRDLIAKLSKIFGVSPSYLLGIEEPKASPASAAEEPMTITSPQEKSLVRDFRSLNEDGRDKAVEYISDLKGNDKYTRQYDPYEEQKNMA